MPSIVQIFSFWVLSLGWLFFGYYGGHTVPNQQLWFALIATFLFGLPLYLAAIYAVTIQRIHLANQFRNLGILYWFLNKRMLPYIGWVLWTITSAFLLLFYLGRTQNSEWIVFVISIPVFLAIHAAFFPIAAREYKSYIALHKSLSWTRWVTALTMAAFYVLYMKLTGEYQTYTSLAEAVQIHSRELDSVSNSVLILETVRLLRFVEGLKAYVLSNLHSLNDILFLVSFYIGSVILFYNIALALSSFMVPLSEYRRVLIPLQDVETPSPIPSRSIAVTSALVTFFIFFIYVPLTVYMDAWLRSKPQVVEQLRETQIETVRKVEYLEKIGNDYYKPGTIEQTRQAYLEAVNELDVSVIELRKTANDGFQVMAKNVDDYLDWYYSLLGEYERIAALVTGKLEEWMIDKLEAYLMEGNAFSPVQQSIKEAMQKNQELRIAYLEKVNRILTENKIELINQQPEVIQFAPLEAIKAPPSHSVIINLENRLLISGGTSVITALIAGKITGKVVAKGAISLGAKALIKVAAGKTAGILGSAGAGVASGAAIGSVLPGVGTAIGASIGGIIGGLSAGLGVEHLLLKLEEHYSRDEFKQQILEAIDEARLEFENSLKPSE